MVVPLRNNRLDHIAAFRAFVRVAQSGSFTAAGAHLSTGPSAVTKKIASLEKALGVRLFHRTTHGVALTDEGSACLATAHRVLAEIEGMEQQLALRRAGVSGHLRLSAPAAMGQVYLLPALPRLFARHPALSLQLEYSDSPPDLVDAGLDLAVRIGAPRDARLVARLLARSRRVTCASPAYLDRHGEPADAAQLRDHACITLLLHGRRRTWRFATPEGDTTWLPPPALVVNSGVALREAVLGGLGIVQCNSILVAPELRNGRLRVLVPETGVASESLHLVYSRDRHMVPRLKEGIAFLDEVFRPYREPGDGART